MVVRVRAPIRRLARIVLPIVVVIADWQLWDNFETRRLDRAYAPLTGWDTKALPPAAAPSPKATGASVADVEQAGSYYGAAVVAALGQASDRPRPVPEILRRQRESLAGGRPLTTEEVTVVDVVLARNEVVTELVERGASLRFHTFGPEVARPLRMSGLMHAARSEELKTLRQVSMDDLQGAASSIVARLRLLRGFDLDLFGATQKSISVTDAATDIGFLLSRGEVAAAELTALERAFAEAYADWELTAVVFDAARSRYEFVRAVGAGRTWQYGSLGWPLRPVAAHRATGVMRTASEAMQASTLPWPQRIQAMTSVSDHQSLPEFILGRLGWELASVFQRSVQAIATGVAAAASARAAIAVERDRQRTGHPPAALGGLALEKATVADPFSGQPLRYVTTADSFRVYSVGANGRDDGGNFEPVTSKGGAPGTGSRADVGVSVTARPR